MSRLILNKSDKIAILITSFMRDDLLVRCLRSITRKKHWNKYYYILVGYQGVPSDRLKSRFLRYELRHIGKLFELPFDCGLSYSRNFLVQKATERGIKYCVLAADSLHFNDKYNFLPALTHLESNPDYGIVGFPVDESKGEWFGSLELVPKKWFLIKPVPLDWQDGFLKVDIVKNFFIAKTKCLLDNPWDNELKLSEHESAFYELKKTKWQVFLNRDLSVTHMIERNDLYNKYRNRCYDIYLNILKKKYDIEGWVRNEVPKYYYR